MSIELVMPSNHLILCCPLLLLPSVFSSIRVFSNVSVHCIRWPKCWSFSFNISPSNEYSGLISWIQLDWFPLDLKEIKQSVLKEISPEYSLDGMMLKLKRQHFGHLIKRADSFQKILMLGTIEGKRRSGWQRMRWLDSTTDSVDINLS